MPKLRIEYVRSDWLEAFLMVVECGNESAAADRLGCDQSTVHRHCRKLARWLGWLPFKSTNPSTLNERGEAFVETARTVVDLLNGSRDPESALSTKVSPANLKAPRKADAG